MTPHFWARVHLGMAIFWMAMVPVVLLTGLKHSVPFLVFVSVWALAVGEFSSWQASMAERRIDPTDDYGEADSSSEHHERPSGVGAEHFLG